MAKLELRDVSYTYRGVNKQALQGVSCCFTEGKVAAVVGPSGSGKTTLLSLMAGLDLPSSGEILTDGESLANLDLDNYRAERVSMVFQAFHLFPLLTAIENVSYPLEMKGVAREKAEERAKELLGFVGIAEEMGQRFPANLSGGEQQRVAIARALASGSRILLADEPTGNLDVDNGERIVELLCRLAHDEEYCVVIVTHNQQIAAASDEVYQLVGGRIVRRV